MSLPNSTIHICKDVKLDNRYLHTIYFQTRADQLRYFDSKWVRRYDQYTYLRKESAIQVEASYKEASSWTYLWVTDPKNLFTYFYFINDVKYINEEVAQLEIELDVMQTYSTNYSLLPCLVEREHTASDEVGEHTLDEGLECGPMFNARAVDIGSLDELCTLVLSSIDLPASLAAGSAVGAGYGQSFENVFSGLQLSAIMPEDYNTFAGYLKRFDGDGITDAIVSMWAYPKALVKTTGSGAIKTVTGVQPYEVEVEYFGEQWDTLFEGYRPRNKKLYGFPYNYMYVSNNAGGCAEYHYERFADGRAMFDIVGGLGPDAAVKLVPRYYKGVALNHEEGITLGSFPTCAWNSDPYKIWLAQNQNTQAHSLEMANWNAGFSAAAALVSGATVNVGGAIAGIQSFTNSLGMHKGLLAQKKDMDVQPHQARGNFSASLNVFNDKQTFSLYYRTITKEYARIIDEYFDLYGYQVNRIKIPNINVRQTWCYTKTCGCQCEGDIPKTDLVKIQAIFDKGITFWKNGDFIGVYWHDNDPVGGES